MPILQINIWDCEVCDHRETTIEETGSYSDPVVTPPNDIEWGYIKKDGKELLACPKCLKVNK